MYDMPVIPIRNGLTLDEKRQPILLKVDTGITGYSLCFTFR